MSDTTFARAVKEVLRHEGGYSNDLHDPGGETAFGISKRSYPDLDIKALTEQDAVAIYRRDFWDRLRAHQMPAPVALVFFDASINQGPHAAILDLQGALDVRADGILGPTTMAAVGTAAPMTTVVRLSARRAMRYAVSRNLTRYGLGWFTRLTEVTLVAGDLA